MAEKLSGFIMKLLKKDSRKIFLRFFYPIFTVLLAFFQVNFGEKMWLILYFSKFSSENPNLMKNYGFIKNYAILRAKPHFTTK